MKKNKEYTDVINISRSSVSLPGYGILRSGKKASVLTSLLHTTDFQGFIDKKLIAEASKVKKKIKFTENPSRPIIYNPKDKQQKIDVKKEAKNSKKIRKVGRDDDDSVIESGFDDNDGEIKFVDIEENERRIREHPILGKIRKK